jgi:hypothetical protein
MDLNKINLKHHTWSHHPCCGRVAQVTFDWFWYRDAHTRDRLELASTETSIPILSQLLKTRWCYLPSIALPPHFLSNIIHVENDFRALQLDVSLLDEIGAERDVPLAGVLVKQSRP